MRPSALVDALLAQGVSACTVQSKLLPQVWTQYGWFYTAPPTDTQRAWFDWAEAHGQRVEIALTVQEALLQATLWQIADDAKREWPVRAKYLRRVK